MKIAYFIRHAKSSWKESGQADIERPLNKRGLRDAPQMAGRLKQLENPAFDALISSPANRAFTTARFFSDVFQITPMTNPEIYEAGVGELFEVIKGVPDEYQTIGIFGHNPTMTQLANLFSSEIIENVPTCGIFKLELEISSWTEFAVESGRLTKFYFPKQFNE